jgi:hypothetical protein
VGWAAATADIMSDTLVPTREVVYLINAHNAPPPYGVKVIALTCGGIITTTVWGKDSIQFFDAWCYCPKVPQDVKDIQAGRFHHEEKAV